MILSFLHISKLYVFLRHQIHVQKTKCSEFIEFAIWKPNMYILVGIGNIFYKYV